MSSPERIEVLDALRGIALLGMFLVHFNDQAGGAASVGLAALYQGTVTHFFEERFWTMFGILFGVGFAVQMRRAETRGAAFAPMYVRRLIALAAFGLFSHAVFGYHVLFEYAVWGLPLLLVRRWSVKPLVIALVISAASWSLYTIVRTSRCVVAHGETACRSQMLAERSAYNTFRNANREAQQSPDYPAVFRARLAHIPWFYSQPFSFLPVNTFTLFLIGVIALRAGFFDEPQRHRRAIAALAAFGVASWAVALWTASWPEPAGSGPLVRETATYYITGGFGLIRGTWLAFAYIGVVLLLVARDRRWLRRLAPFGWTGRMALTNYMLQIAILDLAFSRYALHLTPTPLQGLAAAVVLFAVDAVISRWWLARVRFGPLEWLWRSITYGRLQPWRPVSHAHAGVVRI